MTNKEKYMLNKSNMENKYNLIVGDIIIAKDECVMIEDKKKALVIGKEYEISQIKDDYLIIEGELGKHFFEFKDFDDFFYLKKQAKAYKEKEGKLFYELDWDFITQMAERMASNKGKYEPYNWKKLDNVEDLKQALFRHVIDIMKGNYEDDGREFGHIEAAADDLMMINYQLRNNYNKLASENNSKTYNEENEVVLDDLDLQNTNKSFLPEHNPFKEEVDFDKLTGFILDDITYNILKVDKDIILKKSVLSDYIYEYTKKRFMEKYNLGRIKLLYGEF